VRGNYANHNGLHETISNTVGLGELGDVDYSKVVDLSAFSGTKVLTWNQGTAPGTWLSYVTEDGGWMLLNPTSVGGSLRLGASVSSVTISMSGTPSTFNAAGAGLWNSIESMFTGYLFP